MIDIETEFHSIIADLKAGKRPNRVYTSDDFVVFQSAFSTAANHKQWQELIPILCILDNTITLNNIIYPELLKCLNECDHQEVLVLSLGVARRQIIDEHHKRGERLPMDFLESLEKLIGHENPEVFEWSLRLIESLGSQSIFFKAPILAAKPGFFARFNQHRKACKEIIELLERRWA